jgi:hypothetical protein
MVGELIPSLFPCDPARIPAMLIGEFHSFPQYTYFSANPEIVLQRKQKSLLCNSSHTEIYNLSSIRRYIDNSVDKSC